MVLGQGQDCDLVLRQGDNYGFRVPRMIQDKAQSAVNGMSFARAATPDWIIRGTPLFEYALYHPITLSYLQAGASREAVVRVVAPLGKD